MTRISYSILSLSLSIILFGAKYLGYTMTHSSSVYSDAMESIVNIVGAGFLLFTTLYASKPADSEHPYGHGKMEFISATFEGGLIGVAGILILIESIQAWILKTPIHSLSVGIWIVVFAGFINLGFGLYFKKKGERTHSEALRADGVHLISDFYTSMAVVLGLGLVVLTQWIWIDKILAIAISCFLVWTSYRVTSQALGGLLDTQPKPLLEKLAKVFSEWRIDGIIHIHHLRVMRSGGTVHVDAHVSLPEFWTLDQCHQTLEQFEVRLREHFSQPTDFHFHMDPCFRGYCRHCPVEPCPIRKESFVKTQDFDLPTLLLKDEEIPAYRQHSHEH